MVYTIPACFYSNGDQEPIAVDEKDHLRRLAEQVAEIAALPIQTERSEMWRRINRLERVRPPINFHVEALAWLEIMPDESFGTFHPAARHYETTLRRKIWEFENLDDDRVVTDILEYPTVLHDPGLGIEAEKTIADEVTGSYHCEPVVLDHRDIDKIITHPGITLNRAATETNRQHAEELFGDILRVEGSAGTGYGNAIIDRWCEIRGMDRVFMDMILEPEWTHSAIGRLADNWENRVLSLEEQGLLKLNNGAQECYNGGFAVSDQLPSRDFDGKHVRLKDLWGFSTAQAFVSVSPKMHSEFIIPYEKRVLSHFGLNALACCEPMDEKLADARAIPNLRRVSMSEWVNVERAAKAVGDDIIFSYKPTGTRVAAPEWDEEADRDDLRDFLEKTTGCVVEIVNNAISTCCGEVDRIRRWTRNAKQLAEEYST